MSTRLAGLWDKGTVCAMFVIALAFLGGDINAPVSPLYAGSIYALAIVMFRDSRVFTNRASWYLGKISYGVYILQFPFVWSLSPVLSVPLTLGLAAASWELLERRVIAFGRRLTASWGVQVRPDIS